jgi:hypothetical protein
MFYSDPIIKNFYNIIGKWIKKKDKNKHLLRASNHDPNKPLWVMEMLRDLNHEMPISVLPRLNKLESLAYGHYDYQRKLTMLCYNLYEDIKE